MSLSQVTQLELLPGVRLTAVHTEKFKSSYFGVMLLTQLDRETARAIRRGVSSTTVPEMDCRSSQRSHPYLPRASSGFQTYRLSLAPELFPGSLSIRTGTRMPVVSHASPHHATGFLLCQLTLRLVWAVSGRLCCQSACLFLFIICIHTNQIYL